MNCTGSIDVIDLSTGKKVLAFDVLLAPTKLKAEAKEEILEEVDPEQFDPGESIGRVWFSFLHGEPSYRFKLDEEAVADA